jgi:hypothetical protein
VFQSWSRIILVGLESKPKHDAAPALWFRLMFTMYVELKQRTVHTEYNFKTFKTFLLSDNSFLSDNRIF